VLGVRLLRFQGARPAGRAPALLLAGLLLAACGAAAGSGPASQASPTSVPAPSATAPAVLTEADSGKTYQVEKGNEPLLRLSGQYAWTPPAVTGPASLHQVMYFRDPGYSEWTISIDGDAPVTIRSDGAPNCPSGGACSRARLAFSVTLVPG
jgi:hypothetical protein